MLIASAYFKSCPYEFFNDKYCFGLMICKNELSKFFNISDEDKVDKILVQAYDKKPTDGECLALEIDRLHMTVYISKHENSETILDWFTERWILGNKKFDNIDTFYVVIYEYIEQ